MNIVGIDPGKDYFAWFELVHGRADDCGVVKVGKKDPNAVRYSVMMEASQASPDVLVVETMRYYPGCKEDPNDLLAVQLVAGMVAMAPAGEVWMPDAPTWKGQTPKEIHHDRLAKAIPGAQELISKHKKGDRGHLWDAAGLAWWYYCGRKRT